MKQKDLKRFKEKLIEAKAAIINRVQKAELDGREANAESDAMDLADKASNSYTKELLFSKSSTDRQFLQLIEDALDRIDEDHFGDCENCEEPIGIKRMEAVPWARLCIKCQELQEQGRLD
jgi:DnaK suppressor protein